MKGWVKEVTKETCSMISFTESSIQAKETVMLEVRRAVTLVLGERGAAEVTWVLVL